MEFSLAMNPKRGGNPPNDIKVMENDSLEKYCGYLYDKLEIFSKLALFIKYTSVKEIKQ
jgi:hypothetical protein